MSAKHTPTPWRVEGSVFEHMAAEIVAERGIAQVWQSRNAVANAAFIVRAVNSHEALVEALQAIRDGLRSDGRVWVDNGSGGREAGPDLRSFIDAALAECAKPLSEVA